MQLVVACVPLHVRPLRAHPMSHSAAGLPQTRVWGMDFKSTPVTKLNDFQLTPGIVLNMEFLPINRCAAHALVLFPRLFGVCMETQSADPATGRELWHTGAWGQ